MIIFVRTSTRPNASVGFFTQLASSILPYSLKRLARQLDGKMRQFSPRYSADVLQKIVVIEFDDQDTYEKWLSSEEKKLRDVYANRHNQQHGIVTSESTVTLDPAEADAYKADIASSTWPAKCFLLNTVSGFWPDRMISSDKSADDGLIIDTAVV